MSIRRVTPDEALALVQEGWTFVDVRSIPEFQEGHPEGAFNVPFLHKQAGQMSPNPDFLLVMEQRFAKDTRIVLGCRSGARSLKAAEALIGRGFSQIIDMRGGYHGEVTADGTVACEGWVTRAQPVSTTALAGRSYDELSKQ